MAKIDKQVAKPKTQICIPTDIIMDYDPNGDTFYNHAILMKQIVDTFKEKFGVNRLTNNPHMKAYTIDAKEETARVEEARPLRFRFQDMLQEAQVPRGIGRADAINWDINANVAHNPIPPVVPPIQAEPQNAIQAANNF